MASCINMNSAEVQSLKNGVELSDALFKLYCYAFMDLYGRLPYRDELKSDSKKYLDEQLNIKDGYTKVLDILDFTGKLSVEEAVIIMNDLYRDVEVSATTIHDTAIINIDKKPSVYNEVKFSEPVEITTGSDAQVLNDSLQKLAELYGINFISTNNSELAYQPWIDSIPDAFTSSAFIYNGDIYINRDNFSLDAPLHEMMHLMFGSVKFTNPDLYNNLVSLAESFENYEQVAQMYPNRTKLDLNEEVFITELAKYIINPEGSALSNIPSEIAYDIKYSMTRLLDTVLMGEASTRSIVDTNIYDLSLKDLIKRVNSSIATNLCRFALDDATISRTMANVKESLMRNKELREDCA